MAGLFGFGSRADKQKKALDREQKRIDELEESVRVQSENSARRKDMKQKTSELEWKAADRNERDINSEISHTVT